MPVKKSLRLSSQKIIVGGTSKPTPHVGLMHSGRQEPLFDSLVLLHHSSPLHLTSQTNIQTTVPIFRILNYYKSGEASFGNLQFISSENTEQVQALKPGPNHVVNHGRLFSAKELGTPGLKFCFEEVQVFEHRVEGRQVHVRFAQIEQNFVQWSSNLIKIFAIKSLFYNKN
jgi:hypothetical protein